MNPRRKENWSGRSSARASVRQSIRRSCVCLFVFLVSCCVRLRAQTPAPSPALSPPPYLQQRYDEDWSYLSDRRRQIDPLDKLKYIPLNDRDWYFSLGGEARLRYEYFTEFAFGAGPQDINGYFLQRYCFMLICLGQESTRVHSTAKRVENGAVAARASLDNRLNSSAFVD